MKTLLATINAKYIHTNLAIRILYEMNSHIEGLDWKEFSLKSDKEAEAALCAGYDVVAFSCYIWNITPTLALAQEIKKRNPHTKILLGGPEVSYEWESVIALPQIDFIVLGEGEIPFQEFLQHYPSVEKVSSLVWKKEGEIIQNKMAAVFDVALFKDSQPYKFDNTAELAHRVLYIETSRGCPYKCEFCLASLDNKVRYLPDETIKRTLLYLMEHGKTIKFLDRTFNIKKHFTIDIFKFILANHKPGNVFQFEITADILHPDIIDFIQKNIPKGLLRFEIGIQTVNQKANLEVSRKQNFEKTKEVIKSVADKVELHLDLIVGLPFDYWDDIKYSIEEVFKLFPPELQLGFLKFLKGTPVREKYEKYGYVFDSQPPYQIIESNYLSKQQFADIVKLEHALEIYWNSGKTPFTLKYVATQYSIFDFLLALGIAFGEKRDYHKFSLNDVYAILKDFAVAHYPDDKILQELIAIDYYLFCKVKPKTNLLEEIARADKNSLIEELKLNHHKYRYAALPISFDFEIFSNENKIVPVKNVLIIEYTGVEKPRVINARVKLVS